MIQNFKNLVGVFCLLLLSAGFIQGQSSSSVLQDMFYQYDVMSINSNNIHSTAKSGGFFQVDIPKPGGGVWNLELHDSKVVSDDYISSYVDETGTHTSDRRPAIATQGTVAGDLYTSVSLTINDGFLYGFIKDKSGEYYIEPLSYYEKGGAENQFVIYERSNIKPEAPHKCGTTEMHDRRTEFEKSAQGSQRALDLCFEVEWAIANDFSMFQKYGSVGGAEDHAIGVANNVQTNYDDEFADELQLILVTQFTVSTSGGDPWTSSTNASTLLTSFRNWGPGGFFDVHDVGSLWTNRDFDGGTVGIAFVGVVCTGNRYNCLQDFTTNAGSKRVMVAHELGHNFSSFHDAPGSGFIMAPSVNITNTWSSTSINSINSHVDSRTCLDDCTSSNSPPVSSFTFNVIEECTVGEVAFTSQSTGIIDNYFWEFPGGTPATSTQENPTVLYEDPGTFGAKLTVSNSGGSDIDEQFNIIDIIASPEPDFSYAANENVVSFFNFSLFGDSYSWDFGDGESSTLSDPIHTYIDDGFYTVILTVFSECGEEQMTQVIEIATPPTAGFTSDVEEGCAELTVQYMSQASNNTDIYIWTFEGGNPATSTLENPVVTYAEGGQFDVTMTVENETGEDVVQFTDYVDVIGQPVSSFTFVQNENEFTFTNTSEWGTNFIWVFGDGNSSTEVSPTHTYTEDGDFVVMLTTENECGENTSSQTVTVSLAPVPSFSIDGDAVGCAPFVVNYTSTSSNDPDTQEWTFEGGTPATSTEANPMVTYNSSGLFDVTLTVTNGNGSNTETFTEYIEINADPTAAFTTQEDGLTVSFFNGSVDADSYSWDFGDGQSSSDENPIHTYANEGEYQVILTVDNDCGTSTEEITINNYTPVTSGFGSDVSAGCADLTIQFSDQSSSNVTDWLWTFEGGTPATSTDPNPTVVYSEAGQYDVILTVSHPESEATTTEVSYVAVSDVPTASFDYFDDLFTVDFTNTSIEGVTYSWDFGDGNMSPMESPTHTYAAEGTYEVQLIATNECGSSTTMQTITINALPTAGFSAMGTSGCGPLTVQFNNGSSSNVDSWAWTFEGGTPATSTEESPEVTYSAAGIYNVTLVVTSAAGTDMITEDNYITVLAAPTATINQDVAGNVITATNVGTGGDSNAWSVNGEAIEGEELNYTFPENGTYAITLVTENECGTATEEIAVTVDVYAEVSYSNLPITVCLGAEVQLADNSTNVESREWTLPGSSMETSTDESPVVTYGAVGTYDITLKVINQYGDATETFTGAVTVIDVPSASFTGEQVENMVTFTSDVQGATSYMWDFGDGMTSTEENPVHTYTTNGTFEVTLLVTNDCGGVTATDSYSINSNSVTEAEFAAMKVYPNPASSYLTIDVENVKSENIRISLIDIQGKVVLNDKFSSSIHNVDISNVVNGTYMLRLSSAESTYLKKIVVMK